MKKTNLSQFVRTTRNYGRTVLFCAARKVGTTSYTISRTKGDPQWLVLIQTPWHGGIFGDYFDNLGEAKSFVSAHANNMLTRIA